ncbi:Uncharacterised protein [Mycobacteroides abscessus subsp. abscessus]|nr:Uncharacterised protein [Mycobacteroides abscessus subsp. abscessus]
MRGGTTAEVLRLLRRAEARVVGCGNRISRLQRGDDRGVDSRPRLGLRRRAGVADSGGAVSPRDDLPPAGRRRALRNPIDSRRRRAASGLVACDVFDALGRCGAWRELFGRNPLASDDRPAGHEIVGGGLWCQHHTRRSRHDRGEHCADAACQTAPLVSHSHSGAASKTAWLGVAHRHVTHRSHVRRGQVRSRCEPRGRHPRPTVRLRR